MKAMQELGRGFVEEHGLEAPVEARLLDLVSEVGELSKERLKATRYGRVPFQPPAEWVSDLGDVLFALACVANSMLPEVLPSTEESGYPPPNISHYTV